MNWFLDVVKNKYASFNGRARRQEYWMFTLFYIIGYVVLAVIDAVVGTMVLALIYSLALLLPSLGVAIRRLHDTNRSGWWLLISFLPLIGAIVLLVFLVTEGDKSDNQYGPDPKAEAA